MPRHARQPRPLAHNLRCDRGAALVQFALVAPLFLALIFMIIDDGLAIFTEATLDNATRDATRNILLGTYRAGTPLSTFKSAVCTEMGGLIPDCANNLQVYVENAACGSNFGGLTARSVSGGTLSGNGTFNIGSPSSCMIVQTAYNRPYIPYIGRYVSGGSLLLISTYAFQVEPYS